MAKQKGVVKLEGEIGDISFYKTQDGYLAKEKSAISAQRIRTDPAFARTRENGQEFTTANKAGRLLRESLTPLIVGIADGRVSSRLGRAMSDVVKSDPVSDRGKRNVLNGDLVLLTKFQFNVQTPLEQAIAARYTATYNRASGAGTVTFEPFIPRQLVNAPAEASHYRLAFCMASCNFILDTQVNAVFRTAELPLLDTPVTLPPITASLPAALTDPVFMALGIEMFDFVNGKYYPLKSKANNAAALVLVEGAA